MKFMRVIIVSLFLYSMNVFCVSIRNEISNKLKESSKKETNDVNDEQYDYEYSEEENSDNNEKNVENNVINGTFPDIYLMSTSYRNSNKFIRNASFNDEMENPLKYITQSMKSVEHMTKVLFNELMPSVELPADCLLSFVRIIISMRRSELWAFKFIDANGKIPSGLIEGVSSFFGEYDQCLNIESPPSKSDGTVFHGKYCLATPNIQLSSFDKLENNFTISFLTDKTNHLIREFLKRNIVTIKLFVSSNIYIPKVTLFRIGICIPSNCEAKLIQNAINKVIQPILKIPVEIGPKCNVKSENSTFNQFQITAISVFIILLILVAISTTIEIFLRRKSSKKQNENQIKEQNTIEKILLTFSIIKNTKSLSSTKEDNYQCIYTLNFMFILWIFIALYYLSPISLNVIGFKRIFSGYIVKLISDKNYFWIRTPFPLGALFVFVGVYISLDFFGRKEKKISAPSYIKFAIKKWLRFNIRCVGPILVIGLFSVLGDGPIWHLGEQYFVNSCKTSYWKNLLFLNNQVESLGDICNPPSAFLSIVFQLQIISPLIMIALHFSTKIGIIITVMLMILGCFTSILPTFLGLPIAPFEVSEMDSVDQITRSLTRYYIGTEQYLTPFFTGILVGYLIVNKSRFSNFFNKKLISLILWTLSSLLCSSAFIWGENFKDLTIRPNKLNLLLWFSLGKLLWASGCGCLILLLCTGSGGFVYRFLSLDIFKPITRLNYTFLLLQMTLMYFRLFTIRDNIELTHSYLLQCILVDAIINYIIAYLLYILIECPFNNLVKHFCGSYQSTDENFNHVNSSGFERLNDALEDDTQIEVEYCSED